MSEFFSLHLWHAAVILLQFSLCDNIVVKLKHGSVFEYSLTLRTEYDFRYEHSSAYVIKLNVTAKTEAIDNEYYGPHGEYQNHEVIVIY